jgi:hypothetical protein
MANRGMDGTTQTEIAKTSITSFELLEIVLDAATYRFTNGPWDVTYNSNNYQALGNFLGFSEIQENTQMQIAEVTITLTGLKTDSINFFASTDFIDRTVRIHRQIWNDQQGVVGTYKIFEGRFKSAALEDSNDTITVAGVASNQFVDFERIAGRITNDDDNRFHYPGDRFFEFSHQVLQDLKWAPPS